MASEIQAQLRKTGWTIYAIIRNFIGQVWNGSGWESYSTGNLGTYDISLSEEGTASGHYVGTFPSGIAAAVHGKPYKVTVYRQEGETPAEGDLPVAEGPFEWKLNESGVVLADSAGHGGSASVIALKKVTVVSDGNDNAVTLIGSGSGDGLHAQGGSVTGAGICAKGDPAIDADATATAAGAGIRARAGLYASGIHSLGGSIAGVGMYAQAQAAGAAGAAFDAGSGGKDIHADILNTLRNFYEVITFGQVDDVSPSASSFDTDLTEATTDHYKGMVIAFRDAPLKSQPRAISAYTFGAKGTITVETAFTDVPDDGDKFVILGLIA